MESHLEWNVGDISGTSLRGYLDLLDGDFEKTIERLKALGAEADDWVDDKTTIQFRGRYNGASFTLYDYYRDARLHIGGHGENDFMGGPALDVEGLKAALAI